MPCSKVTINNNRNCDMKCDRAGCFCIPTDGAICVCVCLDAKYNIVRCGNCKCDVNSWKCDQSACICEEIQCVCIPTGGADYICVCRDSDGKFMRCDDCSCSAVTPQVMAKGDPQCSKAECKYIPTEGGEECRFERCGNRVSSSNPNEESEKCTKEGCACIPTDGKDCICICQNADGKTVRCDDCQCTNTPNKCNKSGCFCIVTGGAKCICVCRDDDGGLKRCDDCDCTSNANEEPGNCTKESCACIKTDGKL